MGNGISSDYFGQGWQFLNRLYLAQITGVHEDKGTIDVVIHDGLDTPREQLEIPWGGFSMNGHRSSWIRYMPQISLPVTGVDGGEGGGGDSVWIAFGPRNEARVVGWATDTGTYEEFANERTNNPSRMPVGEFIDLKQGEWDMRSAGGAYLYGNRSGQLLLSAGPTVQMRLDKQNNEVRTEAGLWKIGGGGSFVKLGDVKRTLLPTDFKETDTSILDPTTTKEYFLHLENFLPVPTAIMDLQMGAVRNGKGIPIPSLNGGLPLRHRHKIYVPGQPSATPILVEAFSDEIDANGNRSTTQLTATLVNKTAPAATDTEVVLNKAIAASGTFSATAGGAASITAGGEASLTAGGAALVTGGALAQLDSAGIVSLGLAALSAANPNVHGSVLQVMLLTVFTALLAVANAKNPPPTFSQEPAWLPLQTALTPIVAQLSLPPGPALGPLGPLLSAKVFTE